MRAKLFGVAIALVLVRIYNSREEAGLRPIASE
jgi:hypothetical protein